MSAPFPAAEPFDDANRRLVALVHPADWRNPQPEGRFDLVVIGAGSAGLVTAAGAAGLGAKVALIERGLMGGDCLNVGCVPSKALIRCARAAHEARHAGRFGVRLDGNIEVDFPIVMERMRRLRARIAPVDSASRFRDELGVSVFLGEATFTGGNTLRLIGAHGDRELSFAKACLATGGRPAVPEIEGLETAGYVTNETIFSLTELPRRLAVIGAGPIGCELAQAFVRFGSEVTVIESGRGVLSRDDPDLAALVQRSLERDRVRFICGAKIERVRQDSAEKVLELAGGEAGTLRVDAILVAAGRRPNVEGMGLEAAGVRFDPRRGIEVDDRLRTTNPGIYAAGDCTPNPHLTHAADAMARIVIRNALFAPAPFGMQRYSDVVLPWCTYTDPELATVGRTRRQLEQAGIPFDSYEVKFDHVDRALLDGDEEGLLKVFCARGSGKILGATMLASHAGEMISEITAVMVAGGGMATLADTIHPYPTVADAIRRAAGQYQKTRLTPRTRKLLDVIRSWRVR